MPKPNMVSERVKSCYVSVIPIFLIFGFLFLICAYFYSHVISCYAMETNNSSNQDPSQNPFSAYYLHLGENPRVVLINLQLHGNNYHA